MKAEVTKYDFVNAVLSAAKYADKRTTIPVLAHIHVMEVDGWLQVRGTNQEQGISVLCPGKVDPGFMCTMNAANASAILRSLPSDEVYLDVGKNHHVSVTSGQSRFKLNGLDPREYPGFPDAQEAKMYQIESSALINCIRKASYAANTSADRISLNGVCIYPKGGKLVAAATDGTRAAFITTDADLPEDFGRVLIPTPVLEEIAKMCEAAPTISLGVSKQGGENSVLWAKSGREIYARLYSAEFPDVESVIVEPKGTFCTVAKDALAAAIERVSVMSELGAVKVDFGVNSITLSAESSMLGSASESVEAITSGNVPLLVGLRSKALAQAVAAPDGTTVSIAANDAESMVMIRGSDDAQYKAVIMPYRL